MSSELPPAVHGRKPANSLSRLARIATLLVMVAILIGAAWILFSYLRALSFADIVRAIEEQPRERIFIALALTAVSFLSLATYDIFAARIVAPGRVKISLAAFAGAAANAVSNTVGFHAVTANAVRYRLYRSAALGMEDVARIVSLSWLALGLGSLTVLIIAALADPAALGLPWALRNAVRIFALLLAAAMAGLVWWLSGGKRQLTLWRFTLTFPPAGIAAVQIFIGAIEMAAAIGCLYVLLPPDLAPPFAVFAVAYMGSIMAGIVSHAPGGIGVFEAAIISVLDVGARADLLVALLLYRLIYNILPFLVAAVALTAFELLDRRKANSTADKI